MLVAVVASGILVRSIPLALPTPLVQIGLGAVIAAVPSLPDVHLDPDVFFLLFLPPLLFLTAFFVLPMVMFLREGFIVVDADSASRTVSFGNYVRFLSSPDYLKVLWNTLKLGVIVTALCLILGYPLAFAMARFGPRWQRWILIAVISPLMVSVVIRTFSWQVILRNHGPLNDFLIAIGVVDEPVRLLFTFTGVVIGLVHVYLPYMVLPLASVIEKIDPRFDEAARSLGANVFRRFIEVTLPLSIPGILAGSMLVFTAAVSAGCAWPSRSGPEPSA